MGRIRIGISGWRYDGWRGVYYPRGLPHRRELEYSSRRLSSIEINGTHYSLQRPECFRAWYADTPRGFTFAIKGSRFITHMKQLNDIERPLANFYAQGIFELKEKIGPFLWQFGPRFVFNADKLESFFELLPRDLEAALELARRRDYRLKGRARLAIDANRKLRHAIEIRHDSFLDAAFVKLIRKYGIALVVADTAGKYPLVEDVTSDFVYVRLHGDEVLYTSGYSDEALDRWAARIRAWSTGVEVRDARKITDLPPPARRSRDVYCYFDNDAKVHAPFDALALMEKLELRHGREDRAAGKRSEAGRRDAPGRGAQAAARREEGALGAR